MRIALVNVQLLDGNNVVAPLGVLYIAGQLERDGHTVTVFDGDPGAFPLADEIVAWRPDVVGMSFLTAASSRAYALLRTLRERLPGAYFLAGGVHPTIFPEPTAVPLVELLQPAIYVKGGDYAGAESDQPDLDRLPEAKVVQEYGGEVRLIPYLPQHSTTGLIAAIKKLPEQST